MDTSGLFSISPDKRPPCLGRRSPNFFSAMKPATVHTASLFPRAALPLASSVPPRSTPPPPPATGSVAFAMRRETERRLASLEASVRQLSLWNAPPDQCVLDEIEGLKAGLAFLDEHFEPKEPDAR